MFKTAPKVFTTKKGHLSLQALIWLNNDLKIDVKALDKVLTEHSGAAVINLDSVGCF